jgi:uncharacterized protein (TIGR02145 family)
MYGCKTEEIILHGDVNGYVTDTETGQPIPAAKVTVNPINDTTSTGIDGKYLFKNLIPGNYEVEVSKAPYAKDRRSAIVVSADNTEIDFELHKIPYPRFSERYLDFGLDSTIKSFTITNTGTGKLSYSLVTSQDWITVNPKDGEITTGTDTIKVSINKTGLSEKKHIESIDIVSRTGLDLVRDTVGIYLNGVMDKRDLRYYGRVRIGDQEWMAENLNIGSPIEIHQGQSDNKGIEKWCYDCISYGGLYTWFEAMNYGSADTGATGHTQGICPVGWHIPTEKEVITLIESLGGDQYAGGKLKATSSLWQAPNTGATDESGFSALPGGYVSLQIISQGYYNEDPFYNKIEGIGTDAAFWYSSYTPSFVFFINDPHPIDAGGDFGFGYSTPGTAPFLQPAKMGASVRCVKDPPKK